MKPHIPQVYFCVLSEFVSYTLWSNCLLPLLVGVFETIKVNFPLVRMTGLEPAATRSQI